ncbi:MAG: aspartate carbamoyltransferase catalytic subunit [Chloroherpetonaceae bacterium]
MRHLLGLYGVSADDITAILDDANRFLPALQQSPSQTFKTLSGKTVALCFFENSTRTRTSFDLAIRRLGAGTVNFAASTSSVQKGETLLDTIANLEAMNLDAFVIRHSDSGAAHLVAKHTQLPVINAGDGAHEHPTQALLDMLTLRNTFGRLSGLRILIMGDVLHSRVARSNIFGLRTMGAHVSLCAPPTLLPANIDDFGVSLFSNLAHAVQNCDAAIVLRLQLERETAGFIPSLREYTRFFSLTEEVLAQRDKKLFVLHPGPMNREVEISSAVADSELHDKASQSLILEQVTSGVAVRMAVLQRLLSN